MEGKHLLYVSLAFVALLCYGARTYFLYSEVGEVKHVDMTVHLEELKNLSLLHSYHKDLHPYLVANHSRRRRAAPDAHLGTGGSMEAIKTDCLVESWVIKCTRYDSSTCKVLFEAYTRTPEYRQGPAPTQATLAPSSPTGGTTAGPVVDNRPTVAATPWKSVRRLCAENCKAVGRIPATGFMTQEVGYAPFYFALPIIIKDKKACTMEAVTTDMMPLCNRKRSNTYCRMFYKRKRGYSYVTHGIPDVGLITFFSGARGIEKKYKLVGKYFDEIIKANVGTAKAKAVKQKIDIAARLRSMMTTLPPTISTTSGPTTENARKKRAVGDVATALPNSVNGNKIRKYFGGRYDAFYNLYYVTLGTYDKMTESACEAVYMSVHPGRCYFGQSGVTANANGLCCKIMAGDWSLTELMEPAWHGFLGCADLQKLCHYAGDNEGAVLLSSAWSNFVNRLTTAIMIGNNLKKVANIWDGISDLSDVVTSNRVSIAVNLDISSKALKEARANHAITLANIDTLDDNAILTRGELDALIVSVNNISGILSDFAQDSANQQYEIDEAALRIDVLEAQIKIAIKNIVMLCDFTHVRCTAFNVTRVKFHKSLSIFQEKLHRKILGVERLTLEQVMLNRNKTYGMINRTVIRDKTLDKQIQWNYNETRKNKIRDDKVRLLIAKNKKEAYDDYNKTLSHAIQKSAGAHQKSLEERLAEERNKKSGSGLDLGNTGTTIAKVGGLIGGVLAGGAVVLVIIIVICRCCNK